MKVWAFRAPGQGGSQTLLTYGTLSQEVLWDSQSSSCSLSWELWLFQLLKDSSHSLLKTFWKLSTAGRMKPELLTLASRLFVISALTAMSVAPPLSTSQAWTWFLVLEHSKKFLSTPGLSLCIFFFIKAFCDCYMVAFSSFTPQHVTSWGKHFLTSLFEVGCLLSPVTLFPISHHSCDYFIDVYTLVTRL